ncbi:MAG: ABC transporter ATP-binding protein [Erysipelotrichaceae bacterium]|nr:ABC transporter ATP-binding protein [Erysipelotrichaceae bacterium]MBQ1301031.1 ABC transporter ATP-binding protein [Erysipelotrichaceae bacterium]MBQ2684880.1 ABC transporter ATP-binding protein [Erysipelotrichaceae bacterium]MBR2600452.1 ABC transporter ATP-binding protein [Erysipelotrichaceae bacterium]MBR2791557.1 ABC transporter ATP-binding protein [Erysipelotrichaceae bacterium]
MSSITLKNIKKIYPITAEEVKSNKKKAKKKAQEQAPEEGFVPNLQITDEGVVAVQSFNLVIKDKEFVVLVGPSGCGKSTTLRMIAGLEEITEGELYIGDVYSNNIAPRDRNIAMVFQNYSLYPHMTVYDNMAFSLKLAKVPKDEIDRKVREAAKTLEITQILDRLPKALSGGQRQRVAIGRAIVRQPQVILMDEPLSNLDAKLRGQMRSEIIRLRQKIDTTFVYVTHDQIEAMTLGDRIVVMKDGFIQQVGTPQEVFNHPVNEFVAGFIGTPQINFFHNVPLKKVDGEYYVTIQNRDIKLDEKHQKALKEKNQPEIETVVGVRPVHIELAEDGFTGVIEVSEMMGSEVHLHINLNGDDIVAVIPTANLDLDRVSLGKKISFNFSPTLIHVFDAKTEENLI